MDFKNIVEKYIRLKDSGDEYLIKSINYGIDALKQGLVIKQLKNVLNNLNELNIID